MKNKLNILTSALFVSGIFLSVSVFAQQNDHPHGQAQSSRPDAVVHANTPHPQESRPQNNRPPENHSDHDHGNFGHPGGHPIVIDHPGHPRDPDYYNHHQGRVYPGSPWYYPAYDETYVGNAVLPVLDSSVPVYIVNQFGDPLNYCPAYDSHTIAPVTDSNGDLLSYTETCNM